jgi:hypothetical protein
LDKIVQSLSDFLSTLPGWVGFSLDVRIPGIGLAGIQVRLYVDKALLNLVRAWLTAFEALVPNLIMIPVGRIVAAAGGNRAAAPTGIRSGAATSTNSPGNHIGTVGCFARNDHGLWMVSASHVLYGNGRFAPNPNSRCVWIDTPDQLVGSGVLPTRIRVADTTVIDASACLIGVAPDEPRYPTPNRLPMVGVPVRPPVGTQVKILGVGTVGNVISHPDNIFQMSYSNIPGMGVASGVTMKDQILVAGTIGQPFATPGDSGALVVVQIGNHFQPVGIVIGVEDGDLATQALVTPLDDILSTRLPWVGSTPVFE